MRVAGLVLILVGSGCSSGRDAPPAAPRWTFPFDPCAVASDAAVSKLMGGRMDEGTAPPVVAEVKGVRMATCAIDHRADDRTARIFTVTALAGDRDRMAAALGGPTAVPTAASDAGGATAVPVAGSGADAAAAAGELIRVDGEGGTVTVARVVGDHPFAVSVSVVGDGGVLSSDANSTAALASLLASRLASGSPAAKAWATPPPEA